MTYNFDVELAQKIGVEESIIANHLIFWIRKNKANGKHEHEGRTWTYNSVAAFEVLFPFWTKKQISRILKSLEDQKIIRTGNFNKLAFDRTLWYAFEDESILGLPISPNRKMDSPEKENLISPNGELSFPQTGEPIPDTYQMRKPKKSKQVVYRVAFDPKDGCFSGIDDAMMKDWMHAYPDVNIPLKIDQLSAWLLANPERTTPGAQRCIKNFERFLVNCFSRDQKETEMRTTA
jgi:hypothetical protein